MKGDSDIEMKQRGYNFFGNLAVINFPRGVSQKEKKEFALSLMKKNPSIKTVLEKSGQFKGRLRKMKTKWLAGEKTKEVLYKENNCTFRFNIDETYFSPRLSNERKEVSSYIKKGHEVLVMFAGVSPFPIVIAKNSQAKKIYSNELNKIANKYSELNIKLNHVENKVKLISGDIKKVAERISRPSSRDLARDIDRRTFVSTTKSFATHSLDAISGNKNKIPKKFDIIIMPRPQLKDSFLKQAFMLSKKGTEIYYYDFCKVDKEKTPKQIPPTNPPTARPYDAELMKNPKSKSSQNYSQSINEIVEKIKSEAKKYKKKIKIIRQKQAGEIAPYKIRTRIDFKIMS